MTIRMSSVDLDDPGIGSGRWALGQKLNRTNLFGLHSNVDDGTQHSLTLTSVGEEWTRAHNGNLSDIRMEADE